MIQEYKCTIEYKDIMMSEFMKRYHFETKDAEMVTAAVRFACKLIEVESVIRYEESGVICVVTLGERFDKLSDVVSDNLLLSYCIECVGMELLSKAYERVNQYVYEERKMWLTNYQFLQTEDIKKGLDEVKTTCVTWKKGMLRPAKSVVLRADYVEDRGKSGCEHCLQCGNVNCVFRKQTISPNNLSKRSNTNAVGKNVYSYGINQIFGNNRENEK